MNLYATRVVFSQAKLVVLLRNPIGRAISHHNHDLNKYREVGTLEERFVWEMHTSKNTCPCRSDAFKRGFYAEQLERMLQFFPSDQVLVLISERCRMQPRQHLRHVARFLGLEDVPWVSDYVFKEEHVWVPALGHAALEQDEGTGPMEVSKVRHWYFEEPSHRVRQTLRDFYAREVQRLRAMLGDPIPEWDEDFWLPSLIPREPWLRTARCRWQADCEARDRKPRERERSQSFHGLRRSKSPRFPWR
eukprot:g32077.t1